MKIYTMKEWARDKVFSAQVGQRVSDAVFYEMLNCVPPAFWEGGVMQVGEPHSTDKETYRNLFTTFVRNPDGSWTYAGNCLYGKTEHRKSLFE